MTVSYPQFNLGVSIPVERIDPAITANPLASAHSHQARKGIYRSVFKRVLDVTAIVLAAPLVVPLVAGLAIAVARDGGSPFYTQPRLGKNGRTFRIWKLRSMVLDADARMEGYLASNAAARKEWDETQKLKNDPRITRVGRLLRRASLDELPQLWNVLIGDMSLVGPRPMMVNQQDLYPGTAYYALRPGITGFWQTAGRNHTSFEARAEYDDAYEENVSLLADAKILVLTVGVVLNCTGY